MKLRSPLLTLTLTLTLSACSKQSKMDQMVSLMEELGSAVESAGGDCGKMADRVEDVMKKYDLVGLKAESERIKADKAETEKVMKKYGDRMQKAIPKVRAARLGMMKCADDPKMKAVNAKLKGVM